jgi:hypothetical protein
VLTDRDRVRLQELERESARYRDLADSTTDPRLRRIYTRNADRLDRMAKARRIYPLGKWLWSLRIAVVVFVVLLPYAIIVRLGGAAGLGLAASVLLGALVHVVWRRHRAG